MLAHSIFFYFFSTVAVFAAVMVVVSKNSVNSVLFLILDFVSVSILFIIFLFVVMMLNVSQSKTHPVIKKSFINNISVGYLVGIIFFFELLVVIGGWKYKGISVPLSSLNLSNNISNTHALGNILYTDYIHLFQISGMILLVGMIGAITLTFQKKENVKRQNYFDQIQRDKESAVRLVDVEIGKGVKIDE